MATYDERLEEIKGDIRWFVAVFKVYRPQWAYAIARQRRVDLEHVTAAAWDMVEDGELEYSAQAIFYSKES